jgi:chromosome segregation ATPase
MEVKPMKRPHAIEPKPEPQAAAIAPAQPVKDEAREKLKAAQEAKRAAETRAEELSKQLATATLEIMRLKAEVYDLTHGLT